MNLIELDRALRQLRLSGMAAVLETRLRQAQTEKMAPGGSGICSSNGGPNLCVIGPVQAASFCLPFPSEERREEVRPGGRILL
jgi:hypothetical protein